MKSKRILVAPSVLSADFSEIGSVVEKLRYTEADMIHCDVMDGHFVPNITFGAKFVKDLRQHTSLPLDIHLMISDPGKYADDFIDAGADCISFHIEAVKDCESLIRRIRSADVECGLAISPDTDVEKAAEYLSLLNKVVLMSVYPGFGGQKFMESAYGRMCKLKNMISESGANTLVEVDGGVTFSNACDIVEGGADILVAGNAVFGSDDMGKAISELKSAKRK